MRRTTNQSSLAARLIGDFHRSGRFWNIKTALVCIVIFSVSAILTFWLTDGLGKQEIITILIAPALFSILGFLASVVVTPRLFFVFSAVLGIDLGSIIRWIVTGGI